MAARAGDVEGGDRVMLREVDNGPIAWTAESLPADAGIVPVSAACRDELVAVAALLDANPLPLLALRPADFAMPACREMMRAVKDTLDSGVGFVIIDRLPVEEVDADGAVALYWLLGNMVAGAVAQKWDGTMKYDVRDSGRKPAPGNGVRSSISNAGQEYHVDNSFNQPPDYVALLCLRKAMEGGLSGVVSFQTAHNRLLERYPELLARLYGQFCFDRQHEHAPDDPKLFNRWPVFAWDGDTIRCRFSDRLIFGGHEIAGEPLDDDDRVALDAFKAVINAPGMRREFMFEPGQIQILNNCRLGHRRTAFEDWPEPERRRHLVRLWFRNSGRPFYMG